MSDLTEVQKGKIKQIKGFVNTTCKGLRIIHNSKGITEDEARHVVNAALLLEKDEKVLFHCREYFNETYNYGY